MGGHSNKGFTLIELLIVIAILGLVASMGVVYLLGARKHAKVIAADAYAKHVLTVGYAYIAEDANNALSTKSCMASYTEGSYSASVPPNIVSSCNVTVAADGTPIVTYQASVDAAPLKTIP